MAPLCNRTRALIRQRRRDTEAAAGWAGHGPPTLELGLSVAPVNPPVVGDGTRRLQVVHDHIHPRLRALPGLRRLPDGHAPLQQGQDGNDVGEGRGGRGAAL